MSNVQVSQFYPNVILKIYFFLHLIRIIYSRLFFWPKVNRTLIVNLDDKRGVVSYHRAQLRIIVLLPVLSTFLSGHDAAPISRRLHKHV